MEELNNTNINFDLPKNRSNVIKVVGVGGGGSNAINYMFQQGIVGVDFVVCNTDAQALEESPVPTKIQLGAALTEGLGAGANPEIGARAAEESMEALKSLLATQTKMVFITAGMGGGTGTGAAPILAKMAKEMDILTVGIVTMPFQFEGKLRLEQAQKGLDNIKAAVDSLIVINNNKLREVYGNLGFKAGFSKADEVLATAARGIAEVITHHYTQNIDLKDAKTVLTNSGTAIMGSAQATGENRAQEAIVAALDSPLLNDNKITGCKNVLLLIVSGNEEITIDEIGEINDFIQEEAGHNANIIMGVGDDPTLGTSIAVTVIATGFAADQQHEIVNTEAKKIIHNLEEDQTMEHELMSPKAATTPTAVVDDPMEAPLQTPEITPTATLLFDEEEVAPAPKVQEENPVEAVQVPAEEAPAVNTSSEIETPQEVENTLMEQAEPLEPAMDEAAINNLEVVYEIIAPTETLETPEQALDFDIDAIETVLPDTPEEAENTSEDTIAEAPKAEAPTTSPQEVAEASPQFIINDLDEQVLDMEVIDPETVATEEEQQIAFEFDMPFVSVTEAAPENVAEEPQDNPITHHLEEALEAEAEPTFTVKLAPEADATPQEEETPVAKGAPDTAVPNEAVTQGNPFDHAIRETVRSENHKRMEQLKKFNYVFKSNLQKIEELERQPAYKRQGIDLDSATGVDSSRVSVDRDANNDIQLRSNNSFLHDNVD